MLRSTLGFGSFVTDEADIRAADQVPELMNMERKPPTEKQFEILIRMHSDAGKGLRVYYVYEKMKKFRIKR
ncbi:hypothetical protein IFM89_025605 [Coptis chinensis]|uniref:Uncharacterized protein n=1 Tax=Coptis chinensis TaxID=261450 RepID=A0A835M1M6_9MAGN|nr:hypothetical protein IFM89_025605 [Coptis chinensis]